MVTWRATRDAQRLSADSAQAQADRAELRRVLDDAGGRLADTERLLTNLEHLRDEGEFGLRSANAVRAASRSTARMRTSSQRLLVRLGAHSSVTREYLRAAEAVSIRVEAFELQLGVKQFLERCHREAVQASRRRGDGAITPCGANPPAERSDLASSDFSDHRDRFNESAYELARLHLNP